MAAASTHGLGCEGTSLLLAPSPALLLLPGDAFWRFGVRVCAGAVPFAKGDKPIIFTLGELIAHFPRNLWAIKISEPFYSSC